MKTFNFGDTKVYLHKGDLPDSIKFTEEVAVDSETTGLSLVNFIESGRSSLCKKTFVSPKLKVFISWIILVMILLKN